MSGTGAGRAARLFLLSARRANEAVEVISRPGVKLTGGMITLSGRMTLTNNGEKGLFFRLDQGG